MTRLAAGTSVEVIHTGIKRAQGRVVAANPEDISIQTAGGPLRIERKDVRRVSVLPTSNSRKRRALLGLAAGAGCGAAGLAIWATAKDVDIRRDLVVGAGAAAGAGIGAALGAVTGSGPRTIYRAP